MFYYVCGKDGFLIRLPNSCVFRNASIREATQFTSFLAADRDRQGQRWDSGGFHRPGSLQ